MSGEGGPLPAQGHMPFRGHRTLAEVYAPCPRCDQVRATACGFGQCPKATGVGQAVTDLRPVAVARWTEDGQLQFGLFGDGIRLLIVDERCPHDRIYEITHREPLTALTSLVPPGAEIGHAQDDRHEASVARMTALFEGRPHLQVVPDEPGAVA